ncbi:zinc finger and SCAN domain-containing protein 31-like [Ctenocephalides felis]|uniref:zinc finger and SCAN domain-containing protein 31-like n=1 Tax=Ctenocephalides felis TaxID=7515 RepID=UPI000E6E2F7C|nr:zinc finger and SCAN domain-containing protein 31-like [Ctenocephalides felis]
MKQIQTQQLKLKQRISSVKQELEDHENTTGICSKRDEICLQQFLKSEVTVEEDIKQETIDEQDADTSSNEKPYIFNEDISNSSYSSTSFESVSEKCTTSDNLKLHECEICNKTFTRKTNLKQHKMIHTGERPFSCEICNKTFTTKRPLKEHRMLHTGDRPYECKICHKTFVAKKILKQP